MPSEASGRAEVAFTSEFKRNLRRLARRYRRIRSDIEPVIGQLERGETLGDRVRGTGYRIYKVRVRNSDAQRGKSGGYRMIYYLKTQTRVTLVTIYSKSDQGDISTSEISQIINADDA